MDAKSPYACPLCGWVTVMSQSPAHDDRSHVAELFLEHAAAEHQLAAPEALKLFTRSDDEQAGRAQEKRT
jgi:hypothetical protein